MSVESMSPGTVLCTQLICFITLAVLAPYAAAALTDWLKNRRVH